MSHACPGCGAALEPMQHEGIAVSGCVGCGGRFVAFEALRTIVRSEVAPRTDSERLAAMSGSGSVAEISADSRPPLMCPGCQQQMRRHVHQYASGVWVDACAEHGIWLDRGELERLEAYAEAGRQGMSGRARRSAGNAPTPDLPPSVAGASTHRTRDTAYGIWALLDLISSIT